MLRRPNAIYGTEYSAAKVVQVKYSAILVSEWLRTECGSGEVLLRLRTTDTSASGTYYTTLNLEINIKLSFGTIEDRCEHRTNSKSIIYFEYGFAYVMDRSRRIGFRFDFFFFTRSAPFIHNNFLVSESFGCDRVISAFFCVAAVGYAEAVYGSEWPFCIDRNRIIRFFSCTLLLC